MTRKYRAQNDLNRTYGDFYPYMETGLSSTDYRNLMIYLFTCIMRDIIINKRVWTFPFRIGTINVTMRKNPADRQPTNWLESKKQKKDVRFKNLHTNGYFFVILYRVLNKAKNYYSWKNITQVNVYNFGASSSHQQFLKKLTFDTSQDPYKKTYSVPYETPNDFYNYVH